MVCFQTLFLNKKFSVKRSQKWAKINANCRGTTNWFPLIESDFMLLIESCIKDTRPQLP